MRAAKGPLAAQQSLGGLIGHRMNAERLLQLLLFNGRQNRSMRRASIVLPAPGEPIMSIPKPPVAATAMPRLATSCPNTSL